MVVRDCAGWFSRMGFILSGLLGWGLRRRVTGGILQYWWKNVRIVADREEQSRVFFES